MRRPWLIVLIFCLLLVIFIGPRLFVVPRLSQSLGEQLQAELNAEQVEVRLTAPLGWEPVFGRIPRVDMVLTNARVDDLSIAKVELHGRDIRFKIESLWNSSGFTYQGASRLEGTLTVTEEALNDIYWQKADPERNMQLKIEPDSLIFTGVIPFWTTMLSVELRGVLEVWNQSELRLVLQNLEVERTRVPAFLLEVLNENYDFVVDLSIFPEPTAITAVDLQQGKMLIDIGVVR